MGNQATLPNSIPDSHNMQCPIGSKLSTQSPVYFFSGRYPVGRIIQGVPAIYPSTAPIFPASPGKGRRGVPNCSGSNPRCCLEKRREGRLPPSRFDSSVHDIHQCYTVEIDPLFEGIKAVDLKKKRYGEQSKQ